MTSCICRVPKEKLDNPENIECINCGCKGCASGDWFHINSTININMLLVLNHKYIDHYSGG